MALAHRAQIEAFLRQPVDERSDPAAADAGLLAIAQSLTGQGTGGVEVLEGEVMPEMPARDTVPIDPANAAIPAFQL
jgi:hypothetical protein